MTAAKTRNIVLIAFGTSIVALFFVFNSQFKDGNEVKLEKPEINSPLLVDTSMVDVGLLPRSDLPKTICVKIRNVGQKVANIERIVFSCQCANASINVSKIEPGGDAEISVFLDCKDIGPHAATISVRTDLLIQRELQINALWSVTGLVIADPSEVDFGIVELGEKYECTIKVKSPNKTTREELSFLSTSDQLSVRVSVYDDTQLCLSLFPKYSFGLPNSEYIRILGPNAEELARVPVRWSVAQSSIELRPSSLVVNATQSNWRATYKFLLACSDDLGKVDRIGNTWGSDLEFSEESKGSDLRLITCTIPESQRILILKNCKNLDGGPASSNKRCSMAFYFAGTIEPLCVPVIVLE